MSRTAIQLIAVLRDGAASGRQASVSVPREIRLVCSPAKVGLLQWEGQTLVPDTVGAPMPSMGTAGGTEYLLLIRQMARQFGGCALMTDGETAPSIFLACILIAFGVLEAASTAQERHE